MGRYLAGCILGMALLPACAWAQPRCTAPELPDTAVSGWRQTDAGNAVTGSARYRIESRPSPGHGTATLGISLRHDSADQSHAADEPAAHELPGLVRASLQIRHELEDRSHPRGWDADAVEVLLDGTRFPGRLDVIGAPGGMRAIAANWEAWYSEEDLVAALENAREMEVRLVDTAAASSNTFFFDVSSFGGIRRQLVAYWRCTAVPYHDHRH